MSITSANQGAREIAEEFLRKTAATLLARNFEAFAEAFHIPLSMTTRGSRIAVTSRAQLQSIFHANCDLFAKNRITELRRTCEAAEFRHADRIDSTHISRLLVDGKDLCPPYPVFSVIERIDGNWKITRCDYDLSDDTGQARALRSTGSEEDRARRIYQDHLDQTSAALLANDFDAFSRRIALPHVITTETDTIKILTHDDMLRSFRAFSDLYRENGMTDFLRIAKEAKFMSADEILGIHTSHQIRNGKHIVPPYPNRVRLVLCDDGLWRETHCSNAVRNTADNFGKWPKIADMPHLPDLNLDA